MHLFRLVCPGRVWLMLFGMVLLSCYVLMKLGRRCEVWYGCGLGWSGLCLVLVLFVLFDIVWYGLVLFILVWFGSVWSGLFCIVWSCVFGPGV